jgi:hypothetical protein
VGKASNVSVVKFVQFSDGIALGPEEWGLRMAMIGGILTRKDGICIFHIWELDTAPLIDRWDGDHSWPFTLLIFRPI